MNSADAAGRLLLHVPSQIAAVIEEIAFRLTLMSGRAGFPVEVLHRNPPSVLDHPILAVPLPALGHRLVPVSENPDFDVAPLDLSRPSTTALCRNSTLGSRWWTFGGPGQRLGRRRWMLSVEGRSGLRTLFGGACVRRRHHHVDVGMGE